MWNGIPTKVAASLLVFVCLFVSCVCTSLNVFLFFMLLASRVVVVLYYIAMEPR
jgi:hypothetical protein